MMYLMNEGSLTLPFDYADSSMTILKFPEQKSSLTIVRGEMPPELSLAETVELQRNLFQREFKTVVLGDTRDVVLGNALALKGKEFFCMFDRSNIKQYQMNLLIKQRSCFITFSYTQLHAFTNEDLASWERIKSDFTPDPQWFQSVTEAPHE
ncbi:DcrB-related protein [Enterobacillus tribolii]|uniref:DUF1795 domain-containing protein n=1 Tax=Enterobacillus tribolii TaxID=1487935 RepID=A0A370QI22_9GAMM|nr:DcrB-related protein [Enterobacillus tribolii]MBW7982461.1 DUF1795 domain-containing protein [Enterobacillus tribolii]RDK87740.1 hypothetical protein C8D90_1087 [Enterobacillus tribolii]